MTAPRARANSMSALRLRVDIVTPSGNWCDGQTQITLTSLRESLDDEAFIVHRYGHQLRPGGGERHAHWRIAGVFDGNTRFARA